MQRFMLTLMFALAAIAADSRWLLANPISKYRVVAGNMNICGGIRTYLNEYLNLSAMTVKTVKDISASNSDLLGPEFIKLPVGTTYPQGIESQASKLDFYNNGKEDVVFRFDGGGSYITGTILYIMGPEAYKKYGLSNIKQKYLHVYPCQFDKAVRSSSQCPTFSQNAVSAGIFVTVGKKQMYFRGRYTDITILQERNINYLLLRNAQYEAAVIEPVAVHDYKSICLLEDTRR